METATPDTTDTERIIRETNDGAMSNPKWTSLRNLLLLFHLVTLATGISLIWTSVNVFKNYCDKFNGLADVDGRGHSEPIFLSAVFGFFLVFAAVFGVIMFIVRSPCFQIFAFACGLLSVFLAIVSCFSAHILNNSVEVVLSYDLENSMKNYHTGNNISELWDNLQNQLHCCGVHNSTDWNTLVPPPARGIIPDSCYKRDEPGAGVIFTSGCAQVGADIFKTGAWDTYLSALHVTAVISLVCLTYVLGFVLLKTFY